MPKMEKYIKNYKAYPYDKNDHGALIAEADCDYYGFHAHAVLEVYIEKYDIATFTKRGTVHYRKKNQKCISRTTCAYSDEDYEVLKRNNGYTVSFDEHFMAVTLDSAYSAYRNIK